MGQKYYAHSLEGRPENKWQPLKEHLQNVAELAAKFAGAFGTEKWAYAAGLWHDLGKYSKEFQSYIIKAQDPDYSQRGPDHSSAGAQMAVDLAGKNGPGKLLAYAIAGHHAGLPNGKDNEVSCLAKRLEKRVPDYSAFPDALRDIQLPATLPFPQDMSRIGFQVSFFTRMLFSCLVDADFLDTEGFMDPKKSSWRQGGPGLDILFEKLSRKLENIQAEALSTPVNKSRSRILKHCLDAAEQSTGLFSLTVPTGGGKTLSSLAFGLKHAFKHGLKRVIYVIPYTSIIEQNARVFRDILGQGAVLEHHSNFDPPKDDRWSELASENWDAPVVVTTNVQFFESLFACRSSRTRKIHNIAKSVVILDEAQMLPVHLLKPCLEALKELSTSYRTTILLCTATQPALLRTDGFENGLDGVREIISDPKSLYKEFKRVRVTDLKAVPDEALAERLVGHEQVLCVVNTRNAARGLHERIRESGGCFHLSARMCPRHRSLVIERVRSALAGRGPCRVVSTQLVEAGVDIDFPVVYRAMSGIDSIAQAAGRCNREGRLSLGEVFIFQPEKGLPSGYLRKSAQTGEGVLRRHVDPLSLDAVRDYFKNFYWIEDDRLDEPRILKTLEAEKRRADFPFRDVAREFRLIKDGMESVIIRFDRDADKIINGLRHAERVGQYARQAQAYTIQVYPSELAALTNAGAVECIRDQYCVLNNMDIYSKELGLCPENPTFRKIESNIA